MHLVVLPVQVVEPVEHLHRDERKLALVPLRLRPLLGDDVCQRAAVHKLEHHRDGGVLVEGVVQRHEPRALVRAHNPQLDHHLVALGLLEDLVRLRLSGQWSGSGLGLGLGLG